MKFGKVGLVAASGFMMLMLMGANGGCQDTSDTLQNRQQEQLVLNSVQAVGLPNITHWQEKRTYKSILELRDTNVVTFTYTQDMNAGLHQLCNSVGYPIPYAEQYTNPMKWVGQGVTLPQADPNGMFTPADAEGTWVMCQNPHKKDQIGPVYSEPRLIVSPFPLD